jgi:hypothetical protein
VMGREHEFQAEIVACDCAAGHGIGEHYHIDEHTMIPWDVFLDGLVDGGFVVVGHGSKEKPDA